MQNLPHAVLRTMGTSSSYEGCTFEGAYMMGNPGHETYKIEIGNPDRSEEFVLMNGRGEVIKKEIILEGSVSKSICFSIKKKMILTHFLLGYFIFR